MEENIERIIDHPIIEEMEDSYLTYSMSVIMARALPDVRDGLKPSQRRILVAMNDLNLGPRGGHRKCAKIAGDTSGNYHPHGEQVIYPTLVRMAQHWNMRCPLVDGQGNFGSIDGDPPAAMRYTEARMASPAVALLEDLKLDTVDFQPNYDETRTEPTVLPAKFPNLLVNGSSGIAVGMATNMAPHNLGEVVDAIVKVIENSEVSLAELMQVMPGPDFPTGGSICGRRGIVDAFTTGRGAITVRGRLHVEESKGGKQRITETKLYPGYVFVEMRLEEDGRIPQDVFFLIKETTGVGDFVGTAGRPTPLQHHEIEKMLLDSRRPEEEPEIQLYFTRGEHVTIKEGPFQGYEGSVDELFPEKGLVRVLVTIFGRQAPIELEEWQIAKAEDA